MQTANANEASTSGEERPQSAGQVTATLAVDINLDTMLVSALTGFLSFMWLIMRVALFIAFFGNSGSVYQRIAVYAVSVLFIMQRLGVFRGMSASPGTRHYLRNAMGLTSQQATRPAQSAPRHHSESDTIDSSLPAPIALLYRVVSNVIRFIVRFVGLYAVALFPGVDLHSPAAGQGPVAAAIASVTPET